jgi:hypothetical protein
LRPFNSRVVSEAEILECLTTRGQHPLELCFLLGKGIGGWDPKHGLMMAYRIHDQPLADACRAYLWAKG